MNLIKKNIPEYGVSEFNDIFSETVRSAFSLIKIRGEISNLKKHYSGHIFFNLKDENSIINAVCWKSNAPNLLIEPEEGLEIVATGKISTYAKSISVYQLNIENIEVAGEGALLKLIEERKKRLNKQGFFDSSKKQSIPFLPSSIGVITSPTGSVLQDIINRIKERFPVLIQLWPTPVQGKDASKKIIEAINGFNSKNFNQPPQVIIIARGGGSIEDLMPFNDENLSKTVFYSKIPIISAIGHETDTSIIDYVSDLRASTPTAAAEKCVPVRNELQDIINSLRNNINLSIKQILLNSKNLIDKQKILIQEPSNIIAFFYSQLTKLIDIKNFLIEKKIYKLHNQISKLSLHNINPNEKIKNKNLILHSLFKSVKYSTTQNIKNKKNRYKNLSSLLFSSSIEKTLKRGYAIVKRNTEIITRQKILKDKDLVKIKFYDDDVVAKIKKN